MFTRLARESALIFRIVDIICRRRLRRPLPELSLKSTGTDQRECHM